MTKAKILKDLIKDQNFMRVYLNRRSPTLPFFYKINQYKKPQTMVQPFVVLACKNNSDNSSSSKNILQIINEVEKTIIEKRLIGNSTNIVCTLSGGQDSIFLALCLSFLQLQKPFQIRFIWCNHFWQTWSFYTTFHLTRCAVSFSSPIVGFLPFQTSASSLFYKSIRVDYKKKKNLSFFVSTKRELKDYLDISLYNHDKTSPSYTSVKRCFHFFIKNEQDNLPPRLLAKFSTRANIHILKMRYKSSCKSYAKICTCMKKRQRYFYAQRSLYLSLTKKTEILLLYEKQHRQVFDLYGALPQKKKSYKKFIGKTSYKSLPFKLQYGFAPKVCSGRCLKDKGDEAQARNWRHITIERGCTFYESKLCMYGHTGSDRVETILFNLIRGSGKRALACLPWKQRYSHFHYNKFYPSNEQVIKVTHLRCSFL